MLNDKDMIKLIDSLLPSSKRYLIQKGYVEQVPEDGVTVLRLNEAGLRYLANPGGKKDV